MKRRGFGATASPVRGHGFSLVELLVVMTLLLIVIVGVLTTFAQMMKVRKRTETLIEAQQNLKIAVTTLTNSIQMTGLEMIRDAAFLPDPRCDGPGANPVFCALPDRVPTTDGIVLMVPVQDRRFLRPRNGTGDTCATPPPPAAQCTPGTDCVVGNRLDVCTPTGYPDGAWNGQSVVVCGPVAPGTCPADGWVVPAAQLPTAVPLQQPPVCTGPLGSADLCCVVRTVIQGPNCSTGCSRPSAPNDNGPCAGAGLCGETILLDNPLPAFLPTRPQCISITPAQVLHYQVWQLRDPTSTNPDHPEFRRFLMLRRNREVDPNTGQPLWIRVASDVEDLQICYRFDPQCDPSQTCYPWGNWGNLTCADTGAAPTIRRVHSVVLQVTVSTAQPIPMAISPRIPRVPGEQSPCDPSLPLPPPTPSQMGPLQWRYITTCASAILRNLAYNETVDWF